MELSNVKLKATLARNPVSLDRALARGDNPIVNGGYFEARGFVRQTVVRSLGTYSFTNQKEGYHAQHISSDRYKITGHWTYGNPEAGLQQRVVFGYKAYVKVNKEKPMVAPRPELVVHSAENEHVAA